MFKSYFQNREFSFTLKDDVYIRYLSFTDQSEMEKEIQKRQPYKIDIGAVYTHKVRRHYDTLISLSVVTLNHRVLAINTET